MLAYKYLVAKPLGLLRINLSDLRSITRQLPVLMQLIQLVIESYRDPSTIGNCDKGGLDITKSEVWSPADPWEIGRLA